MFSLSKYRFNMSYLHYGHSFLKLLITLNLFLNTAVPLLLNFVSMKGSKKSRFLFFTTCKKDEILLNLFQNVSKLYFIAKKKYKRKH